MKGQSTKKNQEKHQATKRIISACDELESALKEFEAITQPPPKPPQKSNKKVREWLDKVKTQLDELS